MPPAAHSQPEKLPHHCLPALFGESDGAVDWPQATDALSVGVVVFDSRQEILHANLRHREMVGHDIRECGGVEDWLRSMCPDRGHADRVVSSWRNHVWRNQLTRVYSLKCRDGKVREVEFSAALARGGSLVLTLKDVTQARRTEEALRHGKLKFRALFDHTDTGTVLVDRTGRVVDANPAFVEMSGLSLAELRLSPFDQLLPAEDSDGLMARERELVSNGGAMQKRGDLFQTVTLSTRSGLRETEAAYCSVAGGESDFSMGVFLFRPGNCARSGTREEAGGESRPPAKEEGDGPAGRDRSAPVRGECSDDSAQSDWQAAAVEEAGEGVMLLDLRGRVRRANPAAWQWLGRAVERGREGSLAGEKLSSFYTRSAEEAREFNRLVSRSLNQSARWSARLPLRLGDGGTREVEAKVVPVFHRDRPSGLVHVFHPVPDERGEAGSAFAEEEEALQHRYRNQLQTVTSLFALESRSGEARLSALKWRVRLRSAALVTHSGKDAQPLLPLVRDVARELCALAGLGQAEDWVKVSGDTALEVGGEDSTPLVLFVAEVLRISLCRDRAPGPIATRPDTGVSVSLAAKPRPHRGRAESGGSVRRRLTFRADPGRCLFSTGQNAECENLNLLAQQLGGTLLGIPGVGGTATLELEF